MQKEERRAVIVKMTAEMHAGLKSLVARHGESAGVIVRGLLREELMRRGITESAVRAIEDARGIGGPPAPRGNESVRPLARADK